MLANALKVPVGDLLNHQPEPSVPAPGLEVPALAPSPAGREKHARRLTFSFFTGGAGKLALTLLCLVAIVACLICNLAINGAITWAIIPLASILLGWCVGMPFLQFKKHRLLISLATLTLLVFPFLYTISTLSGGWFGPVGVSMALPGLAYLWVVCPIWAYTKLNWWYKLALATGLAAALDICYDLLLGELFSPGGSPAYSLISCLATLLGAVLLAAVGWLFSRKKR